MKKPERSDGFLACFFLNLLWGWGLGLAAALLLVLRLRFGLFGPAWRVVLAAWLLIAYIKTHLIEWSARASSEKDPPRPNKNPYSVKEEPAAPAPEQAQAAEPVQTARPQDGAEVDLEKLEAALDELKKRSEEPEGLTTGQTLEQGG